MKSLLILLACALMANATCPKRSPPTPNPQGEYDFIIVGSGAGGGVTAVRLSEKYKVLLLESGPRLYDNAELNTNLFNSILVGNGLPFQTGDLEVDGNVIGTVDAFGKILDANNNEIGYMKRQIFQHNEDIVVVNGEDVTSKAKIINGQPNPYALPDGAAFGLHIQKTPFMVPFLSMTNASYQYHTIPQIYSQKREISYPRGNVVGGSTSTNWMVFYKGSKHDFDTFWHGDHGLEGWSYADLAPYFLKFENSTHIKGSKKHGYDGPIKTSVSSRFIDFPPVKAWHEAAIRLGWPVLQDANDPENQYGTSDEWQQLVSDEGRRSDSTDYIKMADNAGRVCWNKPTKECGKKQTLHIWTEKFVTKINIDKKTKRATGVEFVSSRDYQYGARTEHPDYPPSADEGLKHQKPYTKWDKEVQNKIHTQGAPVHRDLATDFNNPNGQYIPEVETDLTGKTTTVHARYEVILSTGTVTSAQLLMLSGIGPADHLKAHSIEVIADLPVGQRLQDHQEITLHFEYPDEYEPHFDLLKEVPTFPSVGNWIQGQKSFLGSNHIPGGLDGSSKGPKSKEKIPTWHIHHAAFGILENADFHLALSDLSLDAPSRLPRLVGEFFGYKGPKMHSHLCELSQNHAYGRILLRNADPFAQPLVDPNYASNDEDNYELVQCAKEVRKIMATADPRYTGKEVGPCAEAVTDIQLTQCVRNVVWGHHISSSALMSCESKYAVLDNHARVLGVEGLRVIDLSIFPEIPHGNPTGVVFATAEKLSDMIKQDYPATKDEL